MGARKRTRTKPSIRFVSTYEYLTGHFSRSAGKEERSMSGTVSSWRWSLDSRFLLALAGAGAAAGAPPASG